MHYLRIQMTSFRLHLQNQQLRVQRLRGEKHSFSGARTFRLEVLSEFNITLADGKSSELWVEHNGDSELFAVGELTHLLRLHTSIPAYHYILTLSSADFGLQKLEHHRVYTQQRVPEIVSDIFSSLNIESAQLKWHTTQTFAPLVQRRQPGGSDADFLAAVLTQNGIFYRQQAGDFNFYDDIQNIPAGSVSELPYQFGKALQRNADAIIEYSESYHVLTQDIELHSHTRKQSGNVLRIKNTLPGPPIKGRGKKIIWGEHFDTIESGQRLQRYYQSELNSRRRQVYALSNCPTLQLGQILSITGATDASMQAPQRVMALTHRYEAHDAPIETASELSRSQQSGYHCELLLIDASLPYHLAPVRVHPIGLTYAHTDSAEGVNVLDKQGNYHVAHTADENTHKPGQGSAAVTLTSPYTASSGGFHSPLPNNTPVILGHLNSDANRAMILGSLSDDTHNNVVNHANPTQNKWQTPAGHTLQFDDNPSTPDISLHTPQQAQQLHLQSGTTPHTTFSNTQGDIYLHAGSALLETSDGNSTYNIKGNHHLNVQGSYQQETATGDIDYHSDDALNLQATQNLIARSKESSLQTHSEQSTHFEAGSHISSLIGGDIIIQTEQGDINVSAHNGINIIAEQGFSLSQAGGKIAIDKDDNLSISGNTVTLNASNINFNANEIDAGGNGQAAEPPNFTPAARHWISAQYLDSEGKPISDLPYQIKTDSGQTYTGTLDKNGKTQKHQKLPPGTATITFGNKSKLESQLAQERTQLQASLNQLLAAAKQQAAKDKGKLDKATWYSKAMLYSEAAIKNLAEGAADATEAAGKGIIHLFKNMATVQQLDDEGQAASMSGSTQQLALVDQQMRQLGEQEYGWLSKAKQQVEFLYQDEQLRQMLEGFAESYVHSESALMLDKQVAHFAGGFVPAIVMLLVTKNSSGFASEVAGGEAFGKVGDELAEIEATLGELDKCEEVSGKVVDQEHLVEADIKEQRKNLAKNFYVNSGLSSAEALKHVRAIDFNYPVSIIELTKDQKVYQWQVPGTWQGKYYSLEKVEPSKLGINPSGEVIGGRLIVDKDIKTYIIRNDVKVLKSIAGSIVDTWSVKGQEYFAEGGAAQLFSVEKEEFLEVGDE